CVYKGDVRPTNQCPSTWVCDEVGIELIILDGIKESNENWAEPLDPICIIYFDGNPVECDDILFDYGNGVTITLDEDRTLIGECDYEADYFTVKVKSDTIFNSKYEKLVFVKTSGK
ncbi:MAG: hypothetical protein IJO52_01305, partial [Clostridia bacterium]|nr:hypothetical protein [Clostridia bacterium]